LLEDLMAPPLSRVLAWRLRLGLVRLSRLLRHILAPRR
jgi:hypothetical protein